MHLTGRDGLNRAFQSIAARVEGQGGNTDGGANTFPCVRYIGPGGSGHYVKMVHNGIEYGDMQLIAEATHFCIEVAGLSADAVAATFAELNSGPLAGFLMETTAAVYRKDDAEKPGTPQARKRQLVATADGLTSLCADARRSTPSLILADLRARASGPFSRLLSSACLARPMPLPSRLAT